MKNKFVITIGRQFCSGGAEIGKKVADALGIPYYDKKFIDHTAEVLNCSPDTISKYDEKPVRMWGVYGFQYGSSWYASDPSLMLPIGIKIADAQFETVKKLASEHSCVIVGRCGNFLLQDRKDVVRVFIRADMDSRVKRAEKLYDISESEAIKLIRKTDKIRSDYHNTHTQQKWGSAENYDLIINTSKSGIDNAVKTIVAYIESLDGGVESI